MSLEQFREARDVFSSAASASARRLAFAGIAIVWLFRTGEGMGSKLPDPLLLPVLLFAATLALDLLHYLVATVIWSVFCRLKENQEVCSGTPLDAPAWFNWPTNLFFYSKIASVALGYVLMIRFLYVAWAGS